MTKTAILELTSCMDCPHQDSERYYTADSWEHIMEWKCRKTGRRIALVETFDDDPAIPDFCPLIKEPMPGG